MGSLVGAWEARSGEKNAVRHFLLLGNLIVIMITINIHMDLELFTILHLDSQRTVDSL